MRSSCSVPRRRSRARLPSPTARRVRSSSSSATSTATSPSPRSLERFGVGKPRQRWVYRRQKHLGNGLLGGDFGGEGGLAELGAAARHDGAADRDDDEVAGVR